MNNIDREALAEAVDCLIQDPDSVEMFHWLNNTYDLARRGVPVRLVGRGAVLNPLLTLRLGKESAYANVLTLINRKREDHGANPLDEGDINRRSYMRELMAQKRERGRRLVGLVNQLRSEADKLQGTARMEFERLHASRWQAVRKEREDALRDRLCRRLTSDELTRIKDQLWAEVDQELDEFEEFVRVESRKPLRERAPGGFNFKLQPKGKQ